MRKLVILGLLFFVGLGWSIATFQGLAAQGTYDRIVIDFREEVGSAQIETQVRAIANQFKVRPSLNSQFSEADHLYIVEGDKTLLKSLRRSDIAKYTEYIEPDYVYSIPESQTKEIRKESQPSATSQAPNDPLYSQQWNLHSIGVEASWQETKGGGATVAVIDTGISQVPDLKETKFAEGYDFVNDQIDASDDNGHGTHVAGTIAQSTNNGFGVAGIAYEATLMPLKVLSAGGGGTVADIAEAIRFAADHGADVVNMSLGGGGESMVMQEAIDYAHKKDVVVIGAAGNSAQNSASYPARYPHVIGVAALDASGQKAPYSNFGAGVNLSAPGGSTAGDNEAGGILQNTIDPSTGESIFAAYQGTSMAAPHVAGVAALVKASGVKDPDEVAAVLAQSARKVQDDGLNHFGAGKLDAAAAVKLALKGKITFNDFFRWLRDNGYLNPRFWIDGGVIALGPKLLMMLGSYLLAFFLRNYFPFTWSWSMASGLVAGSSGLFFLKGFYLFDAPQFPMRLLGSSLPELGSAIQASGALNPLTASVLIPLGLVVLLLGHAQGKWFAIGSTLGVSACLAVSAAIDPQMLWLGDGTIARLFLIVNALLCFGLARLASKSQERMV
ncbi:MAG: S8 family serine peptidase [Leptolyngbyaceae cyanobacterium CSU_1_3]|nr:S8 family serine peptidase [Leptolyngbyaceae cyanobacterium CSU_1_3]